jgi:isopenicillin N synthase-like dioxygenase
MVRRVNYHDTDAPKQFMESLRETGFVILENVPFDWERLESVYKEWAEFFSSDLKHNYPKTKQHSGFFPIGSEHAKDNQTADLKEFYHHFAQNKLPRGMSNNTSHLMSELITLGKGLLYWLDVELPEPIRSYLSMPLNEMANTERHLLRPIHCPPVVGETTALRSSAHEDIDLLSLLPAATAPGLEIKDLDGNWHRVDTGPNSIIVNIGDMAQAATRGYLKSTTHRVVNPTGESNTSRYSMPLFLHASPEVELSGELTAGEYLDQRIKEIEG